MTTQITLRLPDELVVFLDDLVQHGVAPSRAAAVVRALRRERRRLVAEQDAAIFAAVPDGDDPDDLLGLARHTGRTGHTASTSTGAAGPRRPGPGSRSVRE